MRKKIIFLLILSLLIISCSEDNSSGPSNENGSGSQGSEIPCNTSNEGMVIKPADSETERICKDGVWEAVLNSSSSVQVIESSSSEIINIPVPVSSSANEIFSSSGEESSSSILSPGETTESSSSETEIIEQSSSSSEEIVESSSSEETKLYLCEDGETYVLDPANCEKVSSSSVVNVSSSSDNKPISSSSDAEFSSSSDKLYSSDAEFSSSSDKLYSSDAESSSSSKKSSSSSFEITFKIYDCSEYECITTAYLNPEIEYGEFLDTRDNQVYRTVQIGEQTWMAQNLNYNTMGSICPLQKDSLCYLYGRLYKWTDAIYACPTGWHLPNADDYQELHNYVEEHNNDLPVGTSLKFGENNIWGFSGLLAGCRTRIGADSEYQWYAYFWTSTETEDGKAKVRLLIKDKDYFGYNTRDKEDWVSVRCIKD